MRKTLFIFIVLLSISVGMASNNCNTPAPTGDEKQSPCDLFKQPTISDIEIIGENIKWYDVENNGKPLSSTDLLIGGSTYYASQTVNQCESTTRLAVKIFFNPPSPPPIGVAFCSGDNPTVLDLGDDGTTWYESNLREVEIPYDTPLVNEKTYYGSNKDLCWKNSKSVVVALTADAPVGEAIQYFCGAVKISDLDVTGTDVN